jgi:hypothetical protein
VQQIATTGR